MQRQVALLAIRDELRERGARVDQTVVADTALLASAAGSKANVPTMGGLLICAAIVGATALLADVSNAYLVAGLLVLTFLAGLGSVDDWLKLTAASRPGGSRQGLHSWSG